jgi:hypothetical protein
MSDELVLTHAIDCEWCGAKVGEPCMIQGRGLSRDPYGHIRATDPRPYSGGRREVHTIRAAPRSQHERWLSTEGGGGHE